MHHIKDHKQETKRFKQRIVEACIIIGICTFVLLSRLFYLQVIQYKNYSDLAKHNQLTVIPIEPNRGLIYDRSGVLLAENIPTFSLNIIPNLVPNIDETIKALQEIINVTPDNIKQFRRSMQQHHRSDPIPLKIKLTQDEVANFYVNQYHFPGVTIDASMIRRYPLADITASTVGYVGRINLQELKTIDPNNYSATNFIGKSGIEKYYEEKLHGKVGYKIVMVDATGHIVRTISQTPPTPGNTLYLSIDTDLEKFAQDAFAGEHGSIVIINPQNGEILALVSSPSFDPNLFANGIDPQTFKNLQMSDDKPMFNRAIRGIFPFGSTIKPFLALQGLDTGTVTANMTISDHGSFTLPNSTHIYRDWVKGGHGTVNLPRAIMVSCDVYFYTLATKLGIANIDNILGRFGFGHMTGIDITDELSGIVSSPKWKMAHTHKSWYPGDTVISGIGQGFMSTTPIQLAMGAAAIAEHGKRFKPHLLISTELPNGEVIDQQPTALQPVILKSPSTWNTVISAMQEVVRNPSGTAHSHFGANAPYSVAAKTGGAQLYHHKDVGEIEERKIKRIRNHTLFIAFAPVEKPEIALAVIAENSGIAPALARKVMDYYFAKAKKGKNLEEPGPE